MMRPRSFAIIPAAGQSLRMGTPKLLLPWGESTVMQTVLAAWQQGGVNQCVVVVAPDDQPVADLCRQAGATVVQPATRPAQMRDSLLAGLEFVQQNQHPTASDCWLAAPADLPDLSPALIGAILQSYAAEPSTIVPHTDTGEATHPVCLPWPAAAEFATFPGSLREFMRTHSYRVLPWRTCDKPADLDTPADYLRRHNRSKRNLA
jgi:molybdenum cofactor cytidylyltransferase